MGKPRQLANAASDGGNLTFSGTGNRIVGDFSNVTVANRVMFQTSTVNGSTSVSAIPNGTNTQADLFVFNSSDANNAGLGVFRASASEVTIRSAVTGTGTALPMTFFTGGSERMRIDASGNLLVGRTNTTNVGSNTNTTAGLAYMADNYAHIARASSATKLILQDLTNRTGTYATFISGSAITGSIDTNGTTTTYATTSDARLKSNIAPAGDAGVLIDQIEVVQYDWTHNNAHEPFGLIAQDLNTIRPEAVVAGDTDEENIEKVWGVDYSKLVPLLIKEVQSLRARVAQLESN
jgi:hypothetical protein